MRRAHKWLGIAAALWLAVLGVTGFFLDHRDWRWIWQTSVPDSLFSEDVLKKKAARDTLVYRIDPQNERRRIGGGKRGFWWSGDAGASWNSSAFKYYGGQSPQVFSVVEETAGTGRLFAATDDGVWISSNGGKSFTQFALSGSHISSLAKGSKPSELLGVIDRSSVFRLDTITGAHKTIALGRVAESELPGSIGLSRFVHDLHYGRGIVNGIVSLLINDAGGIAMLLLPVTGILFWILPLRWKRAGRKPGHSTQRSVMKSLYGWHGVYIGVLTSVAIVYLSVTGIILDHRAGLMDWMKSVTIDRAWLPPVYGLHSWNSEIYSVAGHPGAPDKISLGARSGLYTSEDGGNTWKREALPGPESCFVWSLNRVDNYLFAGGMGCPNSVRKDGGQWQIVKGAGHMPTDAFRLTGGGYAWKSPKGLMEVSFPSGKATAIEITEPKVDGTPIFYLLDGLHSGLIFHEQWKWINDLVSVMAVLLCVSGGFRLWRQRRVVLKRLSWTK